MSFFLFKCIQSQNFKNDRVQCLQFHAHITCTQQQQQQQQQQGPFIWENPGELAPVLSETLTLYATFIVIKTVVRASSIAACPNCFTPSYIGWTFLSVSSINLES